MDHETEVVSSIRLAIAERIGSERYELWISETDLSFADGVLRIASARPFSLEWIRANFPRDLKAACKAVVGTEADLQFCIDATLPVAGPTPTTEEAASDNSQQPAKTNQSAAANQRQSLGGASRATRRFASLSTFVVGDTNRVAHASAEMVSRELGAVSPLFIYGPTGVGKSHLLEGLWSNVRRQRERRRCIYLTAEQFTSYFLESLHGRGLPNFRRRYRGLDLLIIEDVQFFVGKEATISELLHTVDSLAREGRQVAFSADRPPTQLTQLGPELSNRLCGGLVVNMQAPELETRCQILQRAAQSRSIDVPEEVLRLIATRLADDVRKLYGALNRLAATSTAWQQPITTSLARQALEEVFRSSTRHVQLADIERVVCKSFGVEPKVLRSASRIRSVSHPRMLAMWLARKYTRAGLAEIGEFFGRRSHSTVVSAEKKVNCWRSQGQVVRMLDGDCVAEEAIRQIETRLHAG